MEETVKDNREEKGKKIHLFIAICLTLIIALIIGHMVTYILVDSDNDKLITLNSFEVNDTKDNLGYRRLSPDAPKMYKFTTTISREEISQLDDDIYKLIVYRLTGQAYQIYFNGQLIRSIGDMEQGRSNIWNYMSYFDINADSLQEENKLTIKIRGGYELGLLTYPVLITTDDYGNKLVLWFKFFLEEVNLMIMGLLFTVFLLIIFIYSLAPELKKKYLYYGGVGLCLAITMLDYLPFHYLPISFLLFKKIILIANGLGAFFISFIIYKEFDNKLNLILGLSLLGTILLGPVITNNLIKFRQRWDFSLIVYLPVFAGWIYTTGCNFKDSFEARVLFVSSILNLLDVLAMSFVNYFSFNINVIPFRFLVTGTGIIILVIFRYVELQKETAYQKARSEMMYQKAIKDNMTQTYNHQYIISTLQETNQKYSLIMLDIDDFKAINDNYGHQVGDEIIKNTARRVQRVIRSDNLVGRYGGDEFVVVLFDNSVKKAVKAADGIKQAVELPYKTSREVELKISTSIGVYIVEAEESATEALHKADQALYKSKRNGKGQINVYAN